MLAIKNESLEYSSEYAKKVDDTLKEFLEDNFNKGRIQEIECRGRSGFIPYSNNKGGYISYTYKSQLDFYFEPTHTFKKFDEACEHTYNYLLKCYLDDAKISSEEFQKGIDKDCSEMVNLRDEMESSFGEYENSCLEVMVKLEDENTLFFCATLSASDAPYHRSHDDIVEKEINFDSIFELKQQLKTILDDVNVKMFSSLFEECY